MRENRNNSKPWRSRIVLRLKPPDTLPSGWGQLQREYRCQLVRHTLLGERSTLLCPKGSCPGRPSDGAPCETPTLRDQLQRPSGPPDHHRGLHKHRIRGCGPLLLILSLLSSFQLALEHLSQDSCPISGNLILNGISLSRGAPAPFHLCLFSNMT